MEHEIQAKVAIAAALIQAGVARLDMAELVGGSDPQPQLDALMTAVDRIYNALNNPPK